MTDTLDELWRPIAGFESLYEVSSLGRVRSLGAVRPHPWAKGGMIERQGRVLVAKGAAGQARVTLFRRGLRHEVLVRRLVALTFGGDLPCTADQQHTGGP